MNHFLKMNSMYRPIKVFLRTQTKFFSSLSAASAIKPSLDPSTENTRLRRQLALSHRLLDRLSLNESTCNHLTVMAPAKSENGKQVMLVAPGHLEDGSSLHWSQMTASALIGLNEAGEVVEDGCYGGIPEETAACIHRGVRAARPEAKAVFHLHAPYSTAQGCLADPKILPVHQASMRFINRSSYYREYGIAMGNDSSAEGLSIGKSLGEKDILFMCNHGTLVVAPTVHLAFDECYYLERACMSQMMALNAAGGDVTKLAMVDEEIVKMSSKTYTTAEYLQLYSVKHFYAWWNKYLKEEADVFE